MATSSTSPSIPTKRKKVVVSMEQKLEAIKRLDNGETLQKVADDYGVGRFRDKGVPISGPILQQKALHFQKEFDEGDLGFTASVGWLDRWKRRYGVCQLCICGEKLSSDFQEMETFKKKFLDLVETESLTADQIFNCDETGLNYKLLPSKSLASRTEATAPGYKHSKERLTILACSSASANLKMDLVLIGKSKNPRAFKSISKTVLPVKYYSQKSAWMSREIFKECFFKEFVPSTEKFLRDNDHPRKAVLLLDNAPTHPDAEELQDGNIKAMFLPPNVTAICQPMDQGVLETLKRNYRRKLPSTLIEESEEGQDMIERLKRINLRMLLIGLQGLGLLCENEEDDDEIMGSTDEDKESILPLVHRIPGCVDVSSHEVDSWMKEHDQYEITDEEIVALVNSGDGDGDEIEIDEQASSVQPVTISHGDGVRALETAMKYIGQQEEATGMDIMMLQRWRDLAAKKHQSSGKQKKISDFFKVSVD
ncbi:jerky protein homolog-like [Sceloporus undulatus]|uniref:jerky protein homolog-like n=1 Tax=Sceloporus undulatus TaxID=8520 RepID=UPI001C4C6B45|nr:jerky protein homolog-like [Sceloporus undulatus]